MSLAWFLSIAVTPKSPYGTDFGSFTLNGVTFDSSNFVFGAPSLESLLSWQNDDLQRHGIYETLFTAINVNWNTSQTRAAVNVQDQSGTEPSANPGGALMWLGWTFDVSGLLSGFELHFDLFGTRCTTSPVNGSIGYDFTNCSVVQFAPFSHDAATQVPAPATLTLFGAGLLLLGAGAQRARRRQASRP